MTPLSLHKQKLLEKIRNSEDCTFVSSKMGDVVISHILEQVDEAFNKIAELTFNEVKPRGYDEDQLEVLEMQSGTGYAQALGINGAIAKMQSNYEEFI